MVRAPERGTHGALARTNPAKPVPQRIGRKWITRVDNSRKAPVPPNPPLGPLARGAERRSNVQIRRISAPWSC
jgi:hypothetical protein